MRPSSKPERRAVGLEVSGLLTPQPTGIAIYSTRLIEALSARDGPKLQIFYPWRRRHRRQHLPEFGLPERGYLNGSRLHRRVRLLHTLDTRLPTRYRGPLVATVYDVISALPLSAEKGLSSSAFRRKKRRAYAEILERADCIVTISEATRAGLLNLGRGDERVELVPPAIDAPQWIADYTTAPGVAETLHSYGVREPFLLAVGALCPRKNIETVVQAFVVARKEHPELQLLLIGEPAYGWEGSDAESAVDALGDSVVRPGYVPRPVLWEAYREASVFLYLSHYEGFGMPVLEALAAGAEVVASRRGGVPEAAGGHARLVDPDDGDEVDAAVRDALAERSDPARREARRAYALSRTWDRSAARLEALYREF